MLRAAPLLLAAWCLWVVLHVGVARADQSDPDLPALFEQLREAPDLRVAAAVEGQIWVRWLEAGSPAVNKRVQAGIDAMGQGRLDDAIEQFSEVVAAAPSYAEGWNKRATAYYLAGELARSMSDIERTLALEPRHFGAISGMGLIFMQMGDERGALDAFKAVLEIHPRSPSAAAHVQLLTEKLGEKGA